MKHAYAEIPAGQIYYESEGTGEPLLCLHQSLWSSWEYDRLIPLLAKSYRVIAMDTMGFGRSDPAPQGWMMEDYINAIVQFLDTLGIEKTHLVGEHTGAMLSVAMAASHPERLNKVVLSGCGLMDPDFVPYTPDSTGLWAVTTVTQNARERLANRSSALLFMGYEIPMDGSHLIRFWASQLHENPNAPMEGIQKAFIANMEHWDKRGWGVYRALYKFDLESHLPLIKNPTLSIVGTKDCFYPPVCKPPETSATIIPNCKLRYIEGAGIMGLYTHPEEYAKVILEFLQEG